MVFQALTPFSAQHRGLMQFYSMPSLCCCTCRSKFPFLARLCILSALLLPMINLHTAQAALEKRLEISYHKYEVDLPNHPAPCRKAIFLQVFPFLVPSRRQYTFEEELLDLGYPPMTLSSPIQIQIVRKLRKPTLSHAAEPRPDSHTKQGV